MPALNMNTEFSTKFMKFPYLIVIFLVIFLDAWTKNLVVQHLPLYSSIQISTFFNLVHWHNYGAAFSFLDMPGGLQRWLFAFISFSVSVVLIVWLIRLPKCDVLLSLGLSFVLGGALGNLWGRLFKGYVVDFLDFHWGNYHWPAFNIADSAVCVGAIILVYIFFKRQS